MAHTANVPSFTLYIAWQLWEKLPEELRAYALSAASRVEKNHPKLIKVKVREGQDSIADQLCGQLIEAGAPFGVWFDPTGKAVDPMAAEICEAKGGN